MAKFNLSRNREDKGDFRSKMLRVRHGASFGGRNSARRIGAFVVLAIVLAGLAVFAWRGARFVGQTLFSRNPLFDVKPFDIRIEGDVLSRERVIEYAGLKNCSNIFDVSIGRIGMALMDVPRVDSVRVIRRLPAVLEIQVKERRQIARIDARGYSLGVDRHGRLMVWQAGPAGVQRRLPVIRGRGVQDLKPGGSLAGSPLMTAVEIVDICDTTPSLKIEQIEVRDRGELEMRMDDGAVVRLATDGAPAPRRVIEKKIARLIAARQASCDRGKRQLWIDLTPEGNIPAVEQ